MTTARPSTALRRFVAVAIVLPVVLAVAGAVVQLILLPYVPATVAIHWNAAGDADGFASAWAQPLATIGFGLGVPGLIALTTLQGLRRGGGGASYRLMGAVAAAASALVVTALTWTFAMQAAQPATAEPPSVGASMLASVAAAAVVGVLAWFAQPATDAAQTEDPPAEALALGVSERAVWLRTAAMAPRAVVGIALAALAVVVSAIVAWVSPAPDMTAWTLTGLAVLVLALASTTVAFRVRVDGTGLRVASVLGLPALRVPLADVATASVVSVEPMGEFGGWGLRFGDRRRFGVVLRRGEALEVTRRSGKRFVVTVDDARTGAALLQALVAREAVRR